MAQPWWGKLRFPDAKVVIYEVDDTGLARKLAARGAELIETFAMANRRVTRGARRLENTRLTVQ